MKKSLLRFAVLGEISSMASAAEDESKLKFGFYRILDEAHFKQ